MAERSRNNSVLIDGNQAGSDMLIQLHRVLLRIMAETVRWGYRSAVRGGDGEEIEEARIGKKGAGIVEIDEHFKFVQAIFGSGRAGLEMIRAPIEFFTTNYDTLLEDALALNQIEYQDGFSGGGVAFWMRRNYEPNDSTRAIVTKLHGSVDWHRHEEGALPLLRVRAGDAYPGEGGVVMIYPQSTKYLNVQRDPFSELFQRFRQVMVRNVDRVLIICGYSFSDEHINAEIENALGHPRSQLTVVAFANEPEGNLPARLQDWRMQSEWGDRIFVASSQGLYQGASGPFFEPTNGSRDWWTFSGVTRVISQGFPRDVLEQLQ